MSTRCFDACLKLGMSEFCMHNFFVQNWPSCTELTKRHRNCEILQIILSNIALSSALTAATANAKHFGVKVIKYFTVMCVNAAVTGATISSCNKFSCYMRSETSVII